MTQLAPKPDPWQPGRRRDGRRPFPWWAVHLLLGVLLLLGIAGAIHSYARTHDLVLLLYVGCLLGAGTMGAVAQVALRDWFSSSGTFAASSTPELPGISGLGGSSPLPCPHLCPTSTRVQEASGRLQLVALDTGWVPGHHATYAWTTGLHLPVGAAGSAPQLRVVLLQGEEHLPAGDGMGNFFADSRQVPEDVAERLGRASAGGIVGGDALTWVTAWAPIDRLPPGPAGQPLRARAELTITTGEGRRLVARTPFLYVPRVSPSDRIAFEPAEVDEGSCQVCGEELGDRPVRRCPACETPHHDDCWRYLGGCSTFGCRA